MKASACQGREVCRAVPRYHIADILAAASESALLALVVDADEKGFAAEGSRTIVVLVALNIVL